MSLTSLISLTGRPAVLALAPANSLYNRRASGYLRGLIRKTLRKVQVILPHHADSGLLGSPTMIGGKHLMQVGQLCIGHGIDLSLNPTELGVARIAIDQHLDHMTGVT